MKANYLLPLLVAIACCWSIEAQGALVSHWALDESSGTTASDSTSTNHGALSNFPGSPNWTAGRIGGALEFDGLDDLVIVAHNASLNMPTATSFGGWINIDTIKTNTIIDKSSNGSDGSGIHVRALVDTSRVRSWVGNASPANFLDTSPTETIGTGTWYHVITTGTNTELRTYINGVASIVNPWSISSGIFNNTTNLALGGATVLGSPFSLDGRLDDVALWNNQLSGTQVRALYSGGSNAVLNYNAAEVQSLFDLHAANTGSVLLGGRTWTPTAGLTTALGEFELGSSGSYFLRLDPDGTGVQFFIAPVPEPGTFAMLGLGLIGLARRTKRRAN